jgi:protein-disulfide isomerase
MRDVFGLRWSSGEISSLARIDEVTKGEDFMAFIAKDAVFRAALFSGFALILVASGCSSPDSGATAVHSSSSSTSDGQAVVATIDGKPVTLSEVEKEAGDQLAAMEFQYLNQRHQLLDTSLKKLVRDRLFEEEAVAKGTTVENLLESEAGNTEVSREEVAVWYENNKGRVGGRPLEQIFPQVQQFLSQSKRDGAVNEYAKRLEENNNVVYKLEPFRADIDIEGSPFKGPADAPVTIVEFSDFECGYCGRLAQTLDNVKNKYGDEVRVVFRQFPLQMHPKAKKAAEASLCANEQEKFWEMHDLLFQEQRQLDVVALKDKASRLGLDRTAFDECLDSDRYGEQVAQDLRDGAALGVTGTPALFINGAPVQGGAVPFDVLAKLVDEELERR